MLLQISRRARPNRKPCQNTAATTSRITAIIRIIISILLMQTRIRSGSDRRRCSHQLYLLLLLLIKRQLIGSGGSWLI
jgi:hypothetical protein